MKAKISLSYLKVGLIDGPIPLSECVRVSLPQLVYGPLIVLEWTLGHYDSSSSMLSFIYENFGGLIDFFVPASLFETSVIT